MRLDYSELADEIDALIMDRLEKNFSKLLAKQKTWDIGKVATSGSGANIQVYINNSTTAVTVQNPRSFSLTAGQMVVVHYPNFKQDNMAYIDRIK
jgi:hypothetical protein